MGLSKPSLLRSYKRTYIKNYTKNYKSISEMMSTKLKSRSVVRDEGEEGEVNVNRFLIKLGIRTGDGPSFIVTKARTVIIGGLNDRSMFVRYVFELLARINTNIKRKQNSTVTNPSPPQPRTRNHKGGKPQENKVTQRLKGRDDKIPM